MPDYLPLCAYRQQLLPEPCQSCAWWQTTAGNPGAETASELRDRWLPSVEQRWGAAGLLVYKEPSRSGEGKPGKPLVCASLHFAPPENVPRFRTLGFGSLPEEAALLFCLRLQEDGGRFLPRRLILRALSELRGRGVAEVYAVANASSGVLKGTGTEKCRFFSGALLEACGFAHVASNGPLNLMRADLRGLVRLLEPLEALLRRLLHREPAPSPAAWSRPGPTPL